MDGSIGSGVATDVDPEEIQRRARQATWLTGLLTAVIGFATLFRPMVSDVGHTFTLLGAANTAILALWWWLFRSGRIVRQAPVILIALGTIIALPLILISGGPNSQFGPVIPLFPICGVMLGGRRMAIGMTVFWIVALAVLTQAGPALPDLTGAAWHQEKAASRALWLILSSTIALAFALHFDTSAGRLRARLLAMAERDPLTGVANRRGLDAALGRALALAARRTEHLTLTIVDVDHFKRFNDLRGHAEGDLALRKVADTLVAQCREGQDIVARFGGEEFVVVLGGTDRVAARFVADKLRHAIHALGLSYAPGGADALTATIGFVSIDGSEEVSHDTLLRRADAALYEGKRLGRDRSIDADDLPSASAA